MLPTLRVLVSAAALAPTTAIAFDLAGTKHIVAHTREGADIPIGTVTFTPKGQQATYRLEMDMGRFKEFFLSMRQFKCLEGPDITCYVPYPYANPHMVTLQDMSWLQHDLLFFWKKPNDYGAKLANGLIYDLKPSGEALVGKPQAINLDKIASPPDDLATPPFGPTDRDDVSDGSRWIDSLRIE